MSDRPIPLIPRLLLLVGCVLLLCITGPKLHKMCAIKGWIPGGIVQSATVIDKGTEDSSYFYADWVFNSRPGAIPGVMVWTGNDDNSGRARIDKAEYERLQIGQKIDIVTIDNERFYRNSIFVEPGNFAFDLVLLSLELFGIVCAVRSFILERQLGI